MGHLRGGGGTIPEAKTVPGGLLGADYEIANGRYRIQEHLYRRELESAVAGAAGRAGLERECGRLPALGERAGSDRQRRYLASAGKHRRKTRDAADRRRCLGRERARDHGDSGGERDAVAQRRVDRRESPQGGRVERRQAGLRLYAGYGAGRIDQFQSLLFRASGQGGRDHRRPLQQRRAGGGLRDRRDEPALAGLVEPALRRDLPHAGGGDAGAEGDDHQ